MISADTYYQRGIQNNLLKHHGIPHLSQEHTKILTRAARMRTYLQTQPETTFVDLKTTIEDCRTILNGKLDHVDVPRIRNLGSLQSLSQAILNTLKKPSSSETDPLHLQNPANPIATRKPRVSVERKRSTGEAVWKPQPPMTADGKIDPNESKSGEPKPEKKPITPIPSVNANVIGDNQNPFTQYTKQVLDVYTRPAVKKRGPKGKSSWTPKPPTTSGLAYDDSATADVASSQSDPVNTSDSTAAKPNHSAESHDLERTDSQ